MVRKWRIVWENVKLHGKLMKTTKSCVKKPATQAIGSWNYTAN